MCWAGTTRERSGYRRLEGKRIIRTTVRRCQYHAWTLLRQRRRRTVVPCDRTTTSPAAAVFRRPGRIRSRVRNAKPVSPPLAHDMKRAVFDTDTDDRDAPAAATVAMRTSHISRAWPDATYCVMAAGFPAVCSFVNDRVDAEALATLYARGRLANTSSCETCVPSARELSAARECRARLKKSVPRTRRRPAAAAPRRTGSATFPPSPSAGW